MVRFYVLRLGLLDSTPFSKGCVASLALVDEGGVGVAGCFCCCDGGVSVTRYFAGVVGI